VLEVWEAPEAPAARAAWVVDREAVNAAVAQAFDELEVVLFYGDPAYWTPELAAWASAYGDDVVREHATTRDYRMGPETSALHTALVAGELELDGDRRLRRHLANAHRRTTRYGPVLRKERPSSAAKIDAAVASVLAFAARNDALASNLDRRRRRRRRRSGAQPARLVTF
jgi:phage terminase large subunit-like protein